MKRSRNFLRFYTVPIVLFAGVLLTAVFTAIYTTTARTPDGRIISSQWPREFALAFSQYLYGKDETVAVSPEGQSLLKENGLWLQVLDTDGKEVLSQNKPAGPPDTYAPYALLRVFQYGAGESSVCVGSVEGGGVSYTYLIGFPLSISKVTMYVDNARYQSGKALIIAVVALTGILVVTSTVYSYKTFASAEARKKQDEAAKEEWLANITHDLKTPLSPIAGYAEMLSETDGKIAPEQVRRYGGVILKNARYAEALVRDLNLTYRLKSGMLPLHKSRQNITSFVREVVIGILNAPEFARRAVSFDAACADAETSFDPLLMKRALTNIVVNALTHSGTDAAVSVFVESDGRHAVLTVRDNGSGMTQQALDNLFTRYYRGASTEANAEGSGLGMAIARQIIEAHGGLVTAQSALGKGTEIVLRVPI